MLGRPLVRLIHQQCTVCGQAGSLEIYHQQVPSRGNYAYDLMVEVGLARFRDQRQDAEIQRDLKGRWGLSLPASSIALLAHSFLDGLAEKYELHSPSHPGFLGSEGLDQIKVIGDLADFYLDYIRAQGWQSVNVVGLSFGGWIAAELAARHPASVNHLVLTNAVGIWIEEQPITDIFAIDVRFYPERMRKIMFSDPESPLAMMAFPPPDENGNPPTLTDEQLLRLYENQAAFAKVAWNPLMHNPRLASKLRHVTAETLVLWGEDDGLVPPVYGERYAHLIPEASFKTLPGCGHVPPLERPEVFVRAVVDFLG